MEILDSFQLKIINVINSQHPTFWRNSHILGFGRGLKIVNGIMTHTPCLTIFVKKKLPRCNLDSSNIIPKEIDGVPTDVVESGRAFSHSGEVRPAVGGISISNAYRKGGGTLAYPVIDDNNKLYILSCSHVLCRDTVNVVCNDKIVQPSTSKGGVLPTSSIATLERWIPLKFSNTPPTTLNDYNEVDAAIAYVNFNISCNHRTLLTPKLLDGNIIKDISYTKPGDKVWKIGASTNKTYGQVISVNTMYFIESDKGKAYFKDQIIVDMISTFGDSGALGIILDNNKAFGLLIAGSRPYATFFSPIHKVFELLNVKFAFPM